MYFGNLKKYEGRIIVDENTTVDILIRREYIVINSDIFYEDIKTAINKLFVGINNSGIKDIFEGCEEVMLKHPYYYSKFQYFWTAVELEGGYSIQIKIQ